MLADMGIALRRVDMFLPSVFVWWVGKNWQGVLVRKVEPTSPALNLIQAVSAFSLCVLYWVLCWLVVAMF